MIDTDRIINPEVAIETDEVTYYFHIYTKIDKFISWRHTIDAVTTITLLSELLKNPKERTTVKCDDKSGYSSEYSIGINQAGGLCIEIKIEGFEKDTIFAQKYIEWDYEHMKDVVFMMVSILSKTITSAVYEMLESMVCILSNTTTSEVYEMLESIEH